MTTTMEVGQILNTSGVQQPTVEEKKETAALPVPVEKQLEALQEDYQKLQESKGEVDKELKDLKEQLKGAQASLEESKKAVSQGKEEVSLAKKNSQAATIGQQVILKTAEKVIAAIGPILNPLKVDEKANDEVVAPKPSEPVDQKQLLAALNEIENLGKYVEQQKQSTTTYVPSPSEVSEFLSSHIVDIDTKELAARSQEINKLQIAKLAVDLQGLSTRLHELMDKALDPEVTVKTHTLKSRLSQGQKELTRLIKDFESKEKSVHEHLKAIEGQVKEYNEKAIPVEHVGSISNFEHTTKDEVVKGLEERKKVNEDRIKEHDKLAKDWADVLIAKDAIEWQLRRIDIFANIFTDVKALRGQLSDLEGGAENLKKYLRAEEPKVRGKEEELKKVKEDAEKTHGKLCNTYKQHAETGKNCRESAEKTIKELEENIQKAGKPLKEGLDKIYVYDKETKDGITKSSAETLQGIHDERNTLLNKFKVEWSNVCELLDVTSNQKSLTYDLNRTGYAIKENKLVLPADSLFNWKVVGWSLKEEYVVSPYAPKVEEKKDEKEGSEEKKVESK